MKSLILLLLLCIGFTTNAQNALFAKTVDSINDIIAMNSLTYYIPTNQYSAFVKKVSVTEYGIVSFTDSIADDVKSSNFNKVELKSDCCARKNSRTLDLLTIKKWDINYPNAYLKNGNGDTIARIIGLKELDMKNLKMQFMTLQNLCIAYTQKRQKDEILARKEMDKERYNCPDPKLDTKKRAATEEAKKRF
jgi:hypothetical protein